MSDIGRVRKPLDLRPTAVPSAQPAPHAATPRPAAPARPATSARTVSPAPRPVVSPRPSARPAAAPASQADPAEQVAAPANAPVKKSGAWKTVLQFAAGVLIIVLVAFSIVVLYVKYYAG